MKEINLSVYDRINVVLDIFRVGSYNRAVVMIVGFGKFIPFIWNTRIEDRLNAIVDQPLYMSVSQFCRITFGMESIPSSYTLRLDTGERTTRNPSLLKNVNQNG